jgi:hypothetical protein
VLVQIWLLASTEFVLSELPEADLLIVGPYRYDRAAHNHDRRRRSSCPADEVAGVSDGQS